MTDKKELEQVKQALEDNILIDLGYLETIENKVGRFNIENRIKKNQKALTTLTAYAEKQQKPDYFYNKGDWDETHNDIDMLEDFMDCNGVEIMRIGRLVELPDKYKVQLYNPETDEATHPEFDTVEEAHAALAEYNKD